MKNKELITVTEAAALLGISRVAVFKRIKKGQLKARKIGRNYVISVNDVSGVLKRTITDKQKKVIENGVKKVVREYKEALKMLGKE